MRRSALGAAALAVFSLVATTCGGDAERDQADAPGTQPISPATISYAEVAAAYQAARDQHLRNGRELVDLLLAGRVDLVYARTAPALQAEVSLEEVERTFADFRRTAPIGPRLEERAQPHGPQSGGYWADRAWGSGRLRFSVAFTEAGVLLSVEPVRPLPEDPRKDSITRTELRLPFDGLWWISQGPTPEIGNHHAAAPDQRHAYDFVIWREGGTHHGDGADNADYWCWNQRVLAPAAGTVASRRDGVAENRPGVATNTAEPAGNHVVLDLGGGEFALLGHLRRGSVEVEEGDPVRPGDLLGYCGNSGNSSEPHVHMHVQDRHTFQRGGEVGLPLQFHDYEVDGAGRQRGTPSGGQFVRHISPSSSDQLGAGR